VRQAEHSFRGVIPAVCLCVCVCLAVCDIETSKMRRPRPHLERSTAEKFEYSTCNSSHICELQLG